MLRRLCCLFLITFTLPIWASPASTPVARVRALSGRQNRPLLLNGSKTPRVFPERGRTLWPGSRFTESDRERAVMRGLNFIYRTALNRRNFEAYGHDYLWCFYTLSEAVRDEEVRRAARRMGRERAREWRRTHHQVPWDADAGLISDLVFGNDAAESLGLPDEKFKEELKRMAPRFHARSYLLFDPLTEPPPEDVPEECDYCQAINQRGTRVCEVCKHRLRMRSRYDVWYDALITTYTGDRTGITLGAHYVDVLKWLPTLRPYRAQPGGKDSEFYDTAYAVTHIVYTLNNYSRYRLSPRLLPQEFEFLRANLEEAIREKDADMLGEFMDTLRAFGLTTNDPLIRKGMEYYLAHQNTDGSWGERREKDIYLRYHPTWNAVAGLSEYAWAQEGLSFPEVRPLLERWADEPDEQSRQGPRASPSSLTARHHQSIPGRSSGYRPRRPADFRLLTR
ncbi:MAG TPA: hypothetical protein VEV81_16020 [Pyrinomonadaceae bacterium]|nr:hypothetical protein [Pyrinomonadaceae bacterium]